MYKDKDKQREANREQMKRARAKGNTKQDISQGNTDYPRVTDQDFTRLLAADAGAPIVRVSKPGDSDYVLQCETTKAFIESRDKRPEAGKRGKDIKWLNLPPNIERTKKALRGKDIKCFGDLPPDVQATIRSVSESNEEFKRRTTIAINYQHVFPDKFEPKDTMLRSGGVITGKPDNGVCTEAWRAEHGR